MLCQCFAELSNGQTSSLLMHLMRLYCQVKKFIFNSMNKRFYLIIKSNFYVHFGTNGFGSATKPQKQCFTLFGANGFRTVMKKTQIGQNIESEVSAILVLAAADSAIGQIACLVLLKFPSIREIQHIGMDWTGRWLIKPQ